MGLPADRALLLYVCSALTPDPGEARLVRRWVEAVRRSADARVRDAAVLVRPHPERREEWSGVDWSDLGPIVVAGANPVTGSAKADYHDALSHSAAVVGLVTSAFLEAAIAGRPVLTIALPELYVHQEGMLHFRYLLDVEDGLLTVARSFDEHVAQLERVVNGDDPFGDRQQRFLRAFVRPYGLERPATPLFADAVEDLAGLRPEAAGEAAPAWRAAAARWLVRSGERGVLKRLMRDAREDAEQRARDGAVRQHRREHRDKWRRHRRRKLAMRVGWRLKRVRDLVRPIAGGRHDR